LKHFELAKRLCRSRVQRLSPTIPLAPYIDVTGKSPPTVPGKTSSIA